MKSHTRTILSATLMVALGCAVGCNSSTQTTANQPAAASNPNIQSVTFFVEGMIWGTAWTTAVEKQLKQLPGVADVSTNMDEQTATVEFDSRLFKPSEAIDSFTGRFRLSIQEETE